MTYLDVTPPLTLSLHDLIDPVLHDLYAFDHLAPVYVLAFERHGADGEFCLLTGDELLYLRFLRRPVFEDKFHSFSINNYFELRSRACRLDALYLPDDGLLVDGVFAGHVEYDAVWGVLGKREASDE